MSKKRIEWTVLGRKVGTATGWDQADTFCMSLYDLMLLNWLGAWS